MVVCLTAGLRLLMGGRVRLEWFLSRVQGRQGDMRTEGANPGPRARRMCDGVDPATRVVPRFQLICLSVLGVLGSGGRVSQNERRSMRHEAYVVEILRLTVLLVAAHASEGRRSDKRAMGGSEVDTKVVKAAHQREKHDGVHLRVGRNGV